MAGLKTETLHGGATLRVHGEIDLASVDTLGEAIGALRSSGSKRLVLDLGEVTFMDSSGLRFLVNVDAAMRDASTELLLGPISDAVAKLLDVSGLKSHFRFV